MDNNKEDKLTHEKLVDLGVNIWDVFGDLSDSFGNIVNRDEIIDDEKISNINPELKSTELMCLPKIIRDEFFKRLKKLERKAPIENLLYGIYGWLPHKKPLYRSPITGSIVHAISEELKNMIPECGKKEE